MPIRPPFTFHFPQRVIQLSASQNAAGLARTGGIASAGDTGNDVSQSAPAADGCSDCLADVVKKLLLSDEPNRRIDLSRRSFAGNEKVDEQLVHEDELCHQRRCLG